MWTLEISREALKDTGKVERSHYAETVKRILAILTQNPFQNPPPYKKLEPPTANFYSRHINDQHRITYTIHKEEKVVKIVRMWTHYE